MSEVNRQWLLARRPVGMVEESDFELTTTPLPIPGEGQLLIRNRMLAFEPAMRGWIEVEDIDAVMAGHDHLVQAGDDHHAGIGRHVLGSQIFDYWRDPWGHIVEHFTDGDLLNAQLEPGLHDPSVALGTLWGRFAADPADVPRLRV